VRRRLVLLLALILPLLLAGLAAGLLATASGTRFGVAQLQRWLPGLRIEQLEGAALGPLALRGLRYEDETLRLEIDHLQLDWRPRDLGLRRLRIRTLDVGRVLLTLKPRPPRSAARSEPLTRLPLGVIVDHARVAAFELRRPDAEPLLADTLELRGRWLGRRIELRQLSGRLAETGPLQLSARARLDRAGIDIEDLQLRGPGRAGLRGRYEHAGRFDLALDWSELQWPLQGPPQLRSARGAAKLSGALDSYRFRVETQLAEARATLDLLAEGEGRREGLRLQRLDARGLGGRLHAEADVVWAPALQLRGRGHFEGLRPESLLPQLAGVLNGDFAADTTLVDGAPRIDFEARLRDSLWRERPLALAANGRYAEGRLSLTRGELRSAGSRLQLQGQLWPQLAAQASLDSPDLAPLWPGLGGRLQAQLQLRGPLQGPAVEGQISARALHYEGYSLVALQWSGLLDLRGRLAPERLKLQGRLRVRELVAGTLRARVLTLDSALDLPQKTELQLALHDAYAGSVITAASARLDGSAAAHRLQLAARGELGSVELGLRGAADLAGRSWRGQLASGHLAPLKLPDWRLQEPAALALAEARQSLEPACWASRGGRACLRLLRDPGQQRLAFRLEEFNVDYLQAFMPAHWQIDARLSGRAQVDFDAGGRLTGIDARLGSGAGVWKVHGREVFAFQPGVFEAQQSGGGLLGARFELPFADGVVHFQGVLAPGSLLAQRPLSGRLRVELPQIAWLRVFTPEVIGVHGVVSGRFDLGGTLDRPTAQGEVKLQEGRLRLARPGIEIEALNGSLLGDASGRLTLDLNGRSGGGSLRVSGEVLTQVNPMTAQFRILGQEFQVARLPDARIWASPDLQVQLQNRRLQIGGDLTIPRAEITPTGAGSGIGPSADQVLIGPGGRVAAPEAGLFTVAARVRLILGKAVSFKGYGLKAPLTGALTLIEDSGSEARALGEIHLDGGRYKAYGQDLTITTGRLIYSGGFISQPAIDLRAERKPNDDVTIGVTVRGTLEKPQFALSSSPAMTQAQQLSWLVLGRPLEDSGTEGDRARLSGAALALGLSGGDFLAQRLRGSTGLDEISIGARPGETAEQARLTVGKYLSPKLYISYGIGLFQPGNIFKLVYELGRGFKLQTETGVESGGDILYSIER